MIIWNGLGFLGALIPVVLIVFMNSVLGPDLQGWALLTSAVPLWIIGRNFREQPGTMFFDPKTQTNLIVKPQHDLFWVELEYWAIIFTLLGIAELTVKLTAGTSMTVAVVLSVIIFFGRLGFSLYHKYLKKENPENIPSQQSTTTLPDYKNPSERGLGAKNNLSSNSISSATQLPESELKKKAFYAKMRKDRETPKDFGTSDHSKYFPGTIPVRTPITEIEEEVSFEEE